MKNKFLRTSIIVAIIFLVIISGINSFTCRSTTLISEEKQTASTTSEYDSNWFITGASSHTTCISNSSFDHDTLIRENADKSSPDSGEVPIAPATDGPMDSPWPMLSHDLHHTGRSPYSTMDNPGFEKWCFGSINVGTIESSAVIDNNGTIYFGSMGADCSLYALYPNGTKIWSYGVGTVWSTPAISADGTIYVSADHDGSGGSLVAVNPNGTMKWSKNICNQDARSSPCIGEDGTVYVGSTWVDKQGNSFGYLHAFNNLDPNAPICTNN